MKNENDTYSSLESITAVTTCDKFSACYWNNANPVVEEFDVIVWAACVYAERNMREELIEDQLPDHRIVGMLMEDSVTLTPASDFRFLGYCKRGNGIETYKDEAVRQIKIWKERLVKAAEQRELDKNLPAKNLP